MASAFKEFSSTYEEFRNRFPNHPLNEEVSIRISRGKFPDEHWLRARTKKMKELMAPLWLVPDRAERN